VDAVLWTAGDVNMPFALTLVGLDYPPARWFKDEKVVVHGAGGWDFYLRYGKNYFLYGETSSVLTWKRSCIADAQSTRCSSCALTSWASRTGPRHPGSIRTRASMDL
jgi:hypothetical protein